MLKNSRPFGLCHACCTQLHNQTSWADCERVHDSVIFHVCMSTLSGTKDVEDAKSANREDAPQRSMISIGFLAGEDDKGTKKKEELMGGTGVGESFFESLILLVPQNPANQLILAESRRWIFVSIPVMYMHFTGFGLIHPCQILANSWGRCFLSFFVGQRCDKRWHMIPRSHGLLGKLSYLSPTAKNLGCFYVDEGVYWKTGKKSPGDVSNISRLVAPPDNLGWRNPPIICNEFGSCTSLLGSKNEIWKLRYI